MDNEEYIKKIEACKTLEDMALVSFNHTLHLNNQIIELRERNNDILRDLLSTKEDLVSALKKNLLLEQTIRDCQEFLKKLKEQV